jgi:glycerophosphoryl diester phosphodiesterase
MLLCAACTVAAVDIVAHRGASAEAPENTLPAFSLAWEQGADAVEGDFLLTADNEIVCIHDKNTGRVAGKKLAVTTSTYPQLLELDVGAWKHAKYKGTRIPRLADVLSSLPEGRRIFFEIKDSSRIVEPLARQLKDGKISASKLAIICFDEGVVAACKAAMPDVDVHWLVSSKTYEKKGVSGIIATLKRLGADGVDIQASTALTPELGQALRREGLEFHCWTVNDLRLARHMTRLGVDSITTDKPGDLRRWLAKGDEQIVQHLTFEDGAGGPAGISGAALKNKVVKTGKPLPSTGTVALWYRPTKWYDYQTVFDSTAHENVWELWINKGAEVGFRTTPDDIRIVHRLHAVAAVDQWQHIAVTWSQDAVQLYLNGAAATMAKRKNAKAPAGEFCLGGGHAGNTKGTGSWDDVVVLDAVLSPAEVRKLMLDGVDALDAGEAGKK